MNDEPGSRARQLDSQPIGQRLRLERRSVAKLYGFALGYLVVITLTGWLVHGHTGSTGFAHPFTWFSTTIIGLGFLLELMDSAAGMGFGTALALLLLSMGYAPLSVVPVLLIDQAITGSVTAAVHHEFRNVHFSITRGSRSATKLALLIAAFGIIGGIASVLLVYLALALPDAIIRLWAAMGLRGATHRALQCRREPHQDYSDGRRPDL